MMIIKLTKATICDETLGFRVDSEVNTERQCVCLSSFRYSNEHVLDLRNASSRAHTRRLYARLYRHVGRVHRDIQRIENGYLQYPPLPEEDLSECLEVAGNPHCYSRQPTIEIESLAEDMLSDFDGLESVIGVLSLMITDHLENAPSYNSTALHSIRRVWNSVKRIMCRQLEFIRQLDSPIPDHCMNPFVKEWYTASTIEERRNRDRLVLKMIGDLVGSLRTKYGNVTRSLV